MLPDMNRLIAVALATGLVLSAPNLHASQESRCSKGLDVANQELSDAKIKGFGGTVAFAKAAGLLTGATVQKQFGKYRNCIVKVKRARRLIKKARQGKPS